MNPDSPQFSRDLLEARLTALLLGELTPAEEAEVRRALAQDPELSRLHDRIKATIPLLREAMAASAAPASEPAAPRLSEDRRQKVLGWFKVVAPKELAAPKWQLPRWLAPMAAAVVIIAVLAGMLLPATARSKSRSQRAALAVNLRILEGAKEQYALENKLGPEAPVTMDDLKDYLKGGTTGGNIVEPVMGETYSVSKVGDLVTAEGGRVQGRMSVRGSEPRATWVMTASASQPASEASDREAEVRRRGETRAGNRVMARVDQTAPSETGSTEFSRRMMERYGLRGPQTEPGGQAGQRVKVASTTVGTGLAAGKEAASTPSKGVQSIYLPSVQESEAIGGLGQPAGQGLAQVVPADAMTALSDGDVRLYGHFADPSGRQVSAGDTTWFYSNGSGGVGGGGGIGGGGGGGFGGGGFGNQAGTPLVEPSPLTPSLSPSDGERVAKPGEGDLHQFGVAMRGAQAMEAPQGGAARWDVAAATAQSDSGRAGNLPAAQVAGGRAATEAAEKDNIEPAFLARNPFALKPPPQNVPAPALAAGRAEGRVPAAPAQPDAGGVLDLKLAGITADSSTARTWIVVPSKAAAAPAPTRGETAGLTPAAPAQTASAGAYSSIAAGYALAQATPPPVTPPAVVATEAPAARAFFAEANAPAIQAEGKPLAPVTMVEQKVELAVPAVSAVAAPAAADTDTLEPLEIKLPAAAYVGTPVTVPAAGTAKIQERVPILGDVPLLGQKFRSERLAEVAKQAEAGEQLGKPVAEGARKGVAAVTSAGQLKFEVELQRTQTALRYGLVAKADQKESAAGKSREMLGREVREKEVAQVVEKLDSVASGVSALGPAAPAQQLAELDVEIRKAQTKTEELRAKYNISETTENFMSLSNEELARAPRLVAKPAEEIAKEKAEIDAKHYGGYFAANAELKKLQELRAGLAKSEERLSEVAVTGAAAAPLLEEEPKVVSRPVPVPQPEVPTSDNPFSTFSLNVSDVSFKLAASSLENGTLPDPAGIRSEEFINAFDYHDPEPMPGLPLAFAWERARTPFAHNRDLLRLSLQTAARGREPGRPLNLVLLLDNSGSMERADRVAIIREALRVLAGQLQPQDKISVVAFSRTPRLWIDGLPGAQAGELVEKVGNLTPQGGTNLEDALRLAYETAARHYLANGVNRVVLLTDGAANLGDVDPESLKQKVESNRKQGIALDCFGIGWEGYNDDLLEVLSRNGDGRYGFVNTPEEAAAGFANQLAGALQVAAADVKVQVEFNPQRVTAWRQIGYAKHQLTKEQFRDNTVDAAEIGAAETGNALYTMEVNPRGEGPLGMVRARFKVPATGEYREYEWELPYLGEAAALDQSSPSMRLAGAAAAFSEWLASSPFAAEVTPDELLKLMAGVPEVFGADARPKKLEWMIRQAKSLAGK